MKQCPCNSGKSLSECCELFISNTKIPLTAEELMRSRYTAYTLHNVDYIAATNDPRSNDDFDIEASRKWAQSSEWLGLEIISKDLGLETDTQGAVEFIAKFKFEGTERKHHELSYFEKINNKWYFIDGKTVNTPDKRTKPKVGRNDLCDCGSGLKYKKCHGK